MTEPARQENGDTALSAEPYLERIGLSRAEVDPPREASLARLQRAHVTSVPFETFSINGDPYSERSGAGVSLSLAALYDKIVTRRRGGFCFELNGLFGWLLAELGFEVTRLAGRMVNAIELPANHHPLLVGGEEPSLVDVGMGPPMLREPLGLGDSASPDEAGVRWRIDESDRPDAEWILRYRPPDEDWQDRYVFDTTPRSLEYFAATCEYLQSAPESGFTGSPVVTMATPDGHKKLKLERFSVTAGSETTETAVTADTFHALLRDEFGIVFPADSTVAL
ncbi:arylamine n-acetyltransferase [Halogeometricum pallidum JCM 14848]|uniref:Arylamine n-acetyltransferase n=1 Tax=Halogeometricum pallidum JCM 14848 TaxID=1227487 RepID=M0D979_HALPD|nr:arylamine N-acetyltransferase [Halogeometricum pallidum]ELZ31388.1 arylamine n-acetyltransferase [Halogeometricum pallidum JCM 14848]